jgi:S-(hydroxymethyl)glutathione dehydrogenase/alcohol dehydrogenase
MKIRAAVVREQNQFAIETVSLDPPKATEVLIRMRAAGVCHSDLHNMRGNLRTKPPFVLGHEGAGIVEAVGSAVTHVKPGDHVLVKWLPADGTCPACREGHANLCERLAATTFRGWLPDGTSRLTSQDGQVLRHLLSAATMAEYAVVDQASAIPIPEGIPFEVAAIIGCAVMTGIGAVVKTARVSAGSSAAVIGCGGVGLSAIVGCRLAGCHPIVAVDVMDSKLDFAKRFGATHTVNASGIDVAEALRSLTPPGPEYVFDMVGSPSTVQQAVLAVKPAGSVVVAGLHAAKGDVPVPAGALVFQDKRVLGSFAGSMQPQVDLPRLVEMYLSGRLPLDAFISQRYDLTELGTAFADMESGTIVRGVIVFD